MNKCFLCSVSKKQPTTEQAWSPSSPCGCGRYLNEVRTEGGGGLKNCPILRTNSTDRLREMRMRGGVSKNPKIVRASFKYGPLLAITYACRRRRFGFRHGCRGSGVYHGSHSPRRSFPSLLISVTRSESRKFPLGRLKFPQ